MQLTGRRAARLWRPMRLMVRPARVTFGWRRARGPSAAERWWSSSSRWRSCWATAGSAAAVRPAIARSRRRLPSALSTPSARPRPLSPARAAQQLEHYEWLTGATLELDITYKVLEWIISKIFATGQPIRLLHCWRFTLTRMFVQCFSPVRSRL